MQKTTFHIQKMDCPSEEQMIRMKLADLPQIQALEFDIPQRKLTVFHTGDQTPIFQQLDALNFNTTLQDSVSGDAFSDSLSPDQNAQNSANERKLLWSVLSINVFFFLLELSMGFWSNSMGLFADSLDMLADSIVYALALFAVGGTVIRKKKIAQYAGYFQLILAVWGFIEVLRRFRGQETLPEFQTMIFISILALMGNGWCLYLLQKSRNQEAHMQASMIFTSNDVIVNLGVVLAGGLVYVTQSKFPDLIVGFVVFIIVARGSLKILKLSE